MSEGLMEQHSTASYPYNDVVLIESPDPTMQGYHFVGSGVVIGPHTILTATHVVYDTSVGIADQGIKLYPGWNSADPALGAGNISTTYTDHFYNLSSDAAGDLYRSQSASDYAVIDTSYTFSSWMGVLLNYPGGDVHVTGYPASAGGYQTDSVGTVAADPSYSVLDYGTLTVSPGNSGGPLWLSSNGSDAVVGIVSTSGWAVQLTSADWSQIESWVSGDGYSLTAQSTSVPPVATAAPVTTSANNILWRNSNGDVELWNSNGSGGFAGQDLGVVDPSWQIEGTGDFNRAAQDGILWRNSNGDVELWNSNGAGGFTGQDLGNVASSWQIEGAGDFNGVGEDGILWRNSGGDVELWNSNGSGGFTGKDLGNVASSWQVDGVGDFNGDGADGVLWRNTNGDAEIWNANGSGGFTGQDLGVVDSSWTIAGTGDFNGKGEDGILWRNTNGDVEIWNANGSGGFTGEDLGVVPLSWTIEGTGNFNGKAEDGIVWRNTNGDVEVWNANGSGGFTGENLGVVASSWQIFKQG
jgi:V8-like Glu-specific endopeptidase